MVTKNKTNTAKKNEAPGQGDLGQLILNSLRINNEDIMRTLVSKNTEDSLGFTDGQLREIQNLINEMTIAEISHLIGFLFVTFFAVYKTITHDFLFGLIIMIVNIFMNLYPTLLQQENKRRIDPIIKRQKKIMANTV